MNALPQFRLPSFLPGLGRALPQWPHSAALAAALNAALLAGWLRRDDLAPVEGRAVRITVDDAGIEATVRYREGLFRPVPGWERPAVSFRGPLLSFGRLLAREEDPDTLFFHRLLAVEGDTELGLALKNMLDAVDPPAFLRARRR